MQIHPALSRLLPRPARALLRSGLFHVRNRGFSPYVLSLERDGQPFRFYVGDRIGETWHRLGWDWTELDHLRDHVVRPGDVVFECGAHHGEATILLSRWVGASGRVVAFEPVPRNVEILRRQVEINGLRNVTVVHAAVGKEPGRLRITDESNAEVAGRSGPGIEVEVVRLDDWLDRGPTVLKIDVEGFEAELLKGAQQILERRPRVSLELHAPALGRYGTSVEEVLRLAWADRYEWKMQLPGERTVQPFDGGVIDRSVHLFGLPRI